MVLLEQTAMISASLVENNLNILPLLQHATSPRLCTPLSPSLFLSVSSLALSFKFSTMGTFLWQLVTMEQFLAVCLRA